MNRNQNRNLGELITIFLDNGDLTEDDVMPLLKKGTASSLKEKEEKIFVQPLTEGEGECIKECNSSKNNGHCNNNKCHNCPCHKPQQESKEEMKEAIRKAELGLYSFPEEEEPSKKPMCYCGHPEERHNEGSVVEPSIANGMKLSGYIYTRNCKHCVCKEYAEDNQGKI